MITPPNMPPKPPITAAEVSEKWIADCRNAVANGHAKLRAHATEPSIEAKLPNGNWVTLTIPGSGTTFSDCAERDAVMGRLLA